jgi:hypothetical protein
MLQGPSHLTVADAQHAAQRAAPCALFRKRATGITSEIYNVMLEEVNYDDGPLDASEHMGS